MIERVYRRAVLTPGLDSVVVLTDDDRIADVVRDFGGNVEMTPTDCASGTDRIAFAARTWHADAVLNVQGDEPLIDPAVIDLVAEKLQDCEMSTAASPIRDADEYADPNSVKVVVNAAGRALYFSRRTIPYLRDAANGPIEEQLAAFPFLKHLGIYGYRRETLLRLVSFPVSPLEAAERLEQLRALDNGIPIAVARVDYQAVGVDVPEDVARVEALLKEKVLIIKGQRLPNSIPDNCQ